MRTRVFIAGLLAALATGVFGVAAASATTISPEGPFTATSTKVVFKVQPYGSTSASQITCTSGVLNGQVLSQGRVEARPAFGGCTPSGATPASLGPVTITQSLQTVPGFSMSTTSAIMTGINLHVTYRGLSCNYDMQGLALRFGYAKNAGGEVTAFTQPTTTNTLKIANSGPAEANACREFFFANGGPVTVEMLPFTLNHPLKVQ